MNLILQLARQYQVNRNKNDLFTNTYKEIILDQHHIHHNMGLLVLLHIASSFLLLACINHPLRTIHILHTIPLINLHCSFIVSLMSSLFQSFLLTTKLLLLRTAQKKYILHLKLYRMFVTIIQAAHLLVIYPGPSFFQIRS